MVSKYSFYLYKRSLVLIPFNFKPRTAGFTSALKIKKQTKQLKQVTFFASAVPLFPRPHRKKFSFRHITAFEQSNSSSTLFCFIFCCSFSLAFKRFAKGRNATKRVKKFNYGSSWAVFQVFFRLQMKTRPNKQAAKSAENNLVWNEAKTYKMTFPSFRHR